MQTKKTLYDFTRILDLIEFKMFPTWELRLRIDNTRLYLQVQDPSGICNVTGKKMPWSGRKWFLSPYMTDTEVVRTAHKAYITAVMHEADENFLYRGVSIYDPHINVDDLVKLRLEYQLDVREDMGEKV